MTVLYNFILKFLLQFTLMNFLKFSPGTGMYVTLPNVSRLFCALNLDYTVLTVSLDWKKGIWGIRRLKMLEKN